MGTETSPDEMFFDCHFLASTKKKKNARTDKNLPKKRFGNSDFLILCFAAEK